LAAIERRQSARKRDFAEVRLDSLVRETLLLCQDDADRAGMTLRAEGAYPELRVRGDAQLLEQALVNLITNAVRYSGSPDIVVGLSCDGASARITVTDHGCGIAAEHLPRLFERFYRVQKDRSRACGGTGLGLAIVKHILILHRGRVSVQSTPGQGTVFTLSLPVA
jgi:two-component system phosphate regulon sensor histidine kinase PhoR